MKRIALLIANTNGLEGTKADVGKFYRFLQSLQGGAWRNDEIFPLSNPSKAGLIACLNKSRQVSIDYAIVMFSGHGGYWDETILEINPAKETIAASDLLSVAPRQLSVFDCCRVMEPSVLKKSLNEGIETFSSARIQIRDIIRKKYESRILQAIPQQSVLCACSIGQCSYDSKGGAVYIDKLIGVAEGVSETEFMTVGQAHQQAAKFTTQETSTNLIKYNKGPQIPDAYLPKCLSSQQLIFSINPSFYCNYGQGVIDG